MSSSSGRLDCSRPLTIRVNLRPRNLVSDVADNAEYIGNRLDVSLDRLKVASPDASCRSKEFILGPCWGRGTNGWDQRFV
ncbi:uncharacterized protein N7498_003239 [Penicillium cinerascens]|uniref:Uncharacterized protein n=1 Tax=Penicillium cinerascens TaxID=70096 RepID=A0A9W9T6P4_9EURO|nr:uncharacterized protein N7498_003239 [Penicillium cinerascens]KAJ5211593.1 hypothetical protein N7498_003239 [Penicillium cinerascens]